MNGRIITATVLLALVGLAGCGQKSDLGFGPTGPPEVLLKNPPDGAVNFSSGSLDSPKEISALFNKDMDPTSVRSSIRVRKECDTIVAAQPGSPSYNRDTRIVTYKPVSLEADQQYKVTITKGAKDPEGKSLEDDVIWRFSTGPAIDRDPPTFEGIRSVALNSSTEITLRWSAGVDFLNVTPQDKIKYLVFQGQGVKGTGAGSSCQVNFSSPVKTLDASAVCSGFDQDPATAECSYQLTGLSANTQYCFVVRARDRGCHTDRNQRIGGQVTNPGGRLYVANFGSNNLLVFDNAGEAEKVSPRTIQSNQTKLNQPLNLLLSNYTDQSAQKTALYVTNFQGNSVSVFEWKQGDPIPSGDIAPTRILEGTTASLNAPAAMAMLDYKKNGEPASDLYITNINTNTITVFKNANLIRNTSVIPTKIVIGTDRDYKSPIGIALDNRKTDSADDDLLYVVYRDTNNVAIVEGINLKSGQINPNWTISRAPLAEDLPLIKRPAGLHLDADLDRLYIANRGDNGPADDNILIFDQVSDPAVRAQSNRSPSWILRSSALYEPTSFSLVKYQEGVPIEEKKRLYVTSQLNNRVLAFDDIDGQINISNCPANSKGVPICDLTPSLILARPEGQFFNPSGVVVSHSGGLDAVLVTSLRSIEIFEEIPAQGNLEQEPQKMISPSIYGPVGVSVDPVDKTVYLSNFVGNSILAFKTLNKPDDTTNLLPNGNLAPERRIVGPQTRLSGPVGLVQAGQRLYVANLAGNNVLAFDLTVLDDPVLCPVQDCEISPVSEASLNITGLPLTAPIGITVDPQDVSDPQDDLLYVSYRDRTSGIENNSNDGDTIVVYKLDSSGRDLIPFRAIQDAEAALRGPAGIHLDFIRQELYVANRGVNQTFPGARQILVFDVHPQTLETPGVCTENTQQPNFISICSLTTIRSIQHHEENPIPNPFNPLVIGLHSPNDLFLETRSDPPKLYLSNLGRDQVRFDAEEAILVYNNANTASGALLPDRTISSTSVTIFTPAGIFVDPDE